MHLLWAILITAAATAIAIAAILLVRRGAPDGSYFADGDRAAGVFGVIATGFSVLLGLIVFLAFTSYDNARTGAEAEALLVTQQFETAQFFPPAVRPELSHELVCYGRYVVHREWPDLEQGRRVGANPWGVALFRTLKTTRPKTVPEQIAYDKWLDRIAEVEGARRDRNHGAAGVIPGPLWVALLFIAAVIFVFMLFFADRAERAASQAVQMGSVVAVLTATMLLIGFLDDPHRDGFGGLQPVAMEQALRTLDQDRRVVGDDSPLPCEADGTAIRR